MSTYRFGQLFSPKSVAIVGASGRAGSLGDVVLRNLRDRGFAGRIDLVNPRHAMIDATACAPTLTALAHVPDVAVVVSPAQSVPGIVDEAGRLGVAAAVVITAGLGHGAGSLNEQIAKSARASGLRIVGPNCLGFIAPHAAFDASFAARGAKRGALALISQSGAVVAAMLEWAHHNSVGFSGIVSLGDQVDVDFGDCLNHFAEDRGTKAILLYIEAIADARKFMSAARAAARVKPVIAIKSGRHGAGVKAALSHTGALAGSDAVYDAALHRAGILRVLGLDEMFAAAETLSRVAPFRGDRLAVVTNGGGIGVLAVDRLADLKGNLAALAPATIAAIDAKIPTGWSRGNPVDIIGDAGAERYSAAMDAVMRDTTTDAVLVINCPTALAAPQAIAGAVIDVVKKRRAEMIPAPPVFAVWLGASPNVEDQFQSAGIPHFSSETDASSGFMYLVNYNRAQTALMRTPPSLPADFVVDTVVARRTIATALAKRRVWLDPVEAGALLAAYAIPVAPVLGATTPEQAGEMARPLIAAGARVAIKILSQQIPHKSDLGGVVLNLDTEATVINAARKMLDDIARLKPDAHLDGVTIQPMVHWPGAHELIAGIADDPNFGPVVVFGHGGTAAEVIGDKALALPPLDLHLAHDLIARTRIAAVLRGYRNVAPANIEAVALVLVKLAQLCADIPEIRELDLNPLLANAAGVIAIDARVRIEPIAAGTWHGGGNPRCAIRPYPKEWERRLVTSGGAAIAVRPVRPEDEPLYVDFFAHVSLEDRRLRFFAAMKTMDHNFVARLTQIDYARAMAFVALDPASGALLGVVRLHIDANHEEGEFAVLVRTDLKGQGLGWSLMQLIIDYARADGVKVMKGQILAENTTMLMMCAELGFSVADESAGADTKLAKLKL